MVTVENQMKEACEIMENISSHQEEDDPILFIQQVIRKLGEFDERTRAIAIEKINRIFLLALSEED